MELSNPLKSNLFKVYDEMNRGVEFELELKNQLIKSSQKFLFENHIKKLL